MKPQKRGADYVEMMTPKQRGKLNACCGDVSEQVPWMINGIVRKMDKDQWRWFFVAHVLGSAKAPSIEGDQIVIFSRSSNELTKRDAQQCIDLILHFGGSRDPQVVWKDPKAIQAWEEWRKVPEAM